jgi:ferredoxin
VYSTRVSERAHEERSSTTGTFDLAWKVSVLRIVSNALHDETSLFLAGSPRPRFKGERCRGCRGCRAMSPASGMVTCAYFAFGGIGLPVCRTSVRFWTASTMISLRCYIGRSL